MAKFDAVKVKNELVEWIADWFEHNGKGCNVIVGISGGVDSSTVAALCVEALGADRVYGVLMPQGTQSDIDYSYELCEHLGIDYCVVNIGDTVGGLLYRIHINSGFDITEQTKINLPARIRMSTLYAVSQSHNGRVANTCNFSETYVGYDTRFADSVGDFSPLQMFTKTEVRSIAEVLNLPEHLVQKVSLDGLCGKTDEENFGFSYAVLDRYLRTGEIDDLEIKKKIDYMHEKNLFKVQPMPYFEYKA